MSPIQRRKQNIADNIKFKQKMTLERNLLNLCVTFVSDRCCSATLQRLMSAPHIQATLCALKINENWPASANLRTHIPFKAYF
jgi:uncharacterized protein (DUF1919 family)